MCKTVESDGMERGRAGSENLNEVEVEVGQRGGLDPALDRQIFGPAGARAFCSGRCKKPKLAAFAGNSPFEISAQQTTQRCFAQRRCGGGGPFIRTLQVGRQINSVLPYLLLWNSSVRAVRRVRHIATGIRRLATVIAQISIVSLPHRGLPELAYLDYGPNKAGLLNDMLEGALAIQWACR